MQEFCFFIVFLCQYIHSYRFPEMAGMGAQPPKSATGVSKMLSSKCPSNYHTKLEELKFKIGIDFICKVRKQATVGIQ